MKTGIEISEKYRDCLLKYAREIGRDEKCRPEHFREKLKTHLGCSQLLTPFLEPENDGMEKRNLIIAVLGDSITAGHFEQLKDFSPEASVENYDDLLNYFFIDIENVYHEQLRKMLWEEYPLTPVSVVNAGIAGDTIEGMEKRVYRDVVRLDPDLIILNGSMNFSSNHGTTENYKKHFCNVLDILQENTNADLILVTPNMAVPPENDKCLQERVQVIRGEARSREIPLADAYRVWELFVKEFPEVKIADLMANHTNHPTAAGHTVYAQTIMNLLKDKEEESR